jgi:hypothetical protein
MVEKSIDNFLELKPNEPKLEVGNYVEQNGILVPKRYEYLELKRINLDQTPILARSEHQREYYGESGILESTNLLSKHLNLDEKELIDEVLFGSLSQRKRITRYCNLLGVNYDKFTQECSLSYWKKIEGYNRTIVGDSSIPDRFHIFTVGQRFSIYRIVQNLKTLRESVIGDYSQTQIGTQMDNENLIEMYETIRNLEFFDPKHRPIMEIQTTPELKNYFLQTHRCRDFKEANWVLDRDLEESEVEVEFVRGVTESDGQIINTVLFYKDNDFDKINTKEQGSFNFHYQKTFQETMSRIGVKFVDGKFSQIALKNADSGHSQKSLFYKPKMSLMVDGDQIPESLIERLRKLARNGQTITTPIQVFSDGNKAYLKFLELE